MSGAAARTATLPVLLVTAEHGPARAQERAAAARALGLLAAALGPATGSTSVSHTRGISVAAAVIGSPARIGVDLEADRRADPRTGRFFLRDHELAWLAATPARPAEHLRLWTVKEALFKSDPGNDDTIMLSYALTDPSARAGCARREPGGVRFGYGSARLGGRYLSVAACLAGVTPDAGLPTKESVMNTDFSGNTGGTDQGVSAEAVLGRIAEVLAVPVAELTPQTLIRELIRESFMLVELVIDLQEEFGTYFTQKELREIGTIGELVGLLQVSPRG